MAKQVQGTKIKNDKETINVSNQEESIIGNGTIDDIRAKLKDVNQLIKPYQLAYVSPSKECIFLEKNAHFMEKSMLEKLSNNIAEDGFLSQLPFGEKQADGRYLIVSGNHRLKAAIKAGLEYILILYVENISMDKRLAYQLSHNALVGKDDIKMLREIYEEIATLEGKEFAGINGLDLIEVEKIQTNQINDVNIEMTEMKFLFVESREQDIDKILSVLEKSNINEDSKIIIGSFEEFLIVLTDVKERFGVKSNTVAFSKMIDVCEEYLKSTGELEEETEVE